MNNLICITPIIHIKNVKNNLKKIGNLFYYPEVQKLELKTLLINKRIDIIFTNPNKQGFKIDGEVLKDSNIKHIITASTGLTHIDTKFCKENNILIHSLTKEYDVIKNITSTAEHSFALMLSLLRNIPKSHINVTSNFEWNYEKFIGRQLNNLSLGIFGYGRLGQMMHRYAKAFDMCVKIYDPYKGYTDLNELINCDILSLHIHSTPKTHNIINKNIINKFKKNIYIVNTSRGEIINEFDIIESLNSGKVLGYATDVLKDELSNIKNSIVIQNSDLNIIVTPHIGGMTKEAQEIAYNGIINKFLISTK